MGNMQVISLTPMRRHLQAQLFRSKYQVKLVSVSRALRQNNMMTSRFAAESTLVVLVRQLALCQSSTSHSHVSMGRPLLPNSNAYDRVLLTS
ncbi:hypothetical protein CY34DRAFT_728663 [Suillus luteus UH-Slu-Lm8-n1]|uniref:Uncharacterized protein n=1 Tax=Suillus luteus UH-Slu-Lm8-n1 TaxID=930992 RepID=A0A0D0BIW0_9AGAM|nr:hypothetical protein CY34DRAFT_728663 [Suillus luteus UH-Slu-Lm8-n1]